MQTILEEEPGIRPETIRQTLEHHWAMDAVAAGELSEALTEDESKNIYAVISGDEFTPEAITARDYHRREIADIMSGKSHRKLIVLGPCSLDADTDYSTFFDQLQQLQAEHPETLIATRLNGSKPRTEKGWTGMYNSRDPQERRRLFDIYKEAFRRGLPIVTETVEGGELGSLAPYLSAQWLGARDMTSTPLRRLASLIHLPVLIKNSPQGDTKTVASALGTVRGSIVQQQGSGVRATIAGTWNRPGVATLPLTVGKGNEHIGIIARGCDVGEGVSYEVRKQKVAQHIGALCMLAEMQGTGVVIDLSHAIGPMLGHDRADKTRVLPVWETILDMLACDSIQGAANIRGIMAEVGPTLGRTDPNLEATETAMRHLSTLLTRLAVAATLQAA